MNFKKITLVVFIFFFIGCDTFPKKNYEYSQISDLDLIARKAKNNGMTEIPCSNFQLPPNGQILSGRELANGNSLTIEEVQDSRCFSKLHNYDKKYEMILLATLTKKKERNLRLESWSTDHSVSNKDAEKERRSLLSQIKSSD